MAAPSSRITPRADADLPIRFVTAAGLFDGHDSSINIVRRLLQAAGCEVVHLGHNRAVEEIVTAALQEDVHGVAVSSYQGGHLEYFRYLIDRLRARGGGHVQVFGGGGGVIVPQEIRELETYGVARIYSPRDGQQLGLKGMVEDMLTRCRSLDPVEPGDSVDFWLPLARRISQLEAGGEALPSSRPAAVPVLGITGTGGAGKSSLTDELIRRFRQDYGDALRIAVLAVDPTRRRSGGALLGDRIRMNSLAGERIYFRSLATRDAGTELPRRFEEILAATRASGFDLVIIETPGIGQGDAGIVPFADVALYVMTPEFGAASQLEKIDMLDFADAVAINKFDRQGGSDALRDVAKQLQRNREAFHSDPAQMPVFGTIAARFNDDGVTALYRALQTQLVAKGLRDGPARLADVDTRCSTRIEVIVPTARRRYLAEIAEAVRGYHAETLAQARIARERGALALSRELLADRGADTGALAEAEAERERALSASCRELLAEWPAIRERYAAEEMEHAGERVPLRIETLSGTRMSRLALPRFTDPGDLLAWLRREHLPGFFPFTAGVFPIKRAGEEPTRMFAGEGNPARTNARFHALSEHSGAKRLSTAFDSVTLYGRDPDPRPDIYGKVGNSGVSVATLEDMQDLYAGFDLCDPMTSVSMTINGPAPTILAMYLNTAIDQQRVAFETEHGRAPDAGEQAELRARTLRAVRGTVQADILKEDQGQNTCIFSTEFSLRVMADIQQYFIDNDIRRFYSVSISGYHIAEAGANPISQLAFTLANGFTYVESYLARGMAIDDFAPSLSFFFSNGMEPEYSVLGRVARRIWAVALRERYGASPRSQRLKYHIQTSGRSLHAQEMSFNDIRTTLQALIAVYDNCNSLHTNAFDEAVTTPTGESVRRALAIQLIINREWGLAQNENPNQGAFLIEELTELVEEAVLAEFERISERGGVLGAMERGYQRGRIQDEALLYESRKHDGSLPLIGVNTFLGDSGEENAPDALQRSTTEEKEGQIRRLKDFQQRHAEQSGPLLERLQREALDGGNVFAVLMDAVRCCSLGQISDALFEVGGEYRRNV